MHWQKCVRMHKKLGMRNADIANLFCAHRNLVARCINDHDINMPKFANHKDEEVKNKLHEILNLNNDLGELCARGASLANIA